MKRSKKAAVKQAAKKQAAKKRAGAEPPEHLYRPFEKLAKKDKGAQGGQPSKGGQAAQGKPGAQDGQPQGGTAAQPSGAKTDAKAKPSAPKAAASRPGKQGPATGKAGNAAADGPSDAETFAIYMAGVRALEDKHTRIPRSADRLERAAKSAVPIVDPDGAARAELRALVVEGIRFETTDDGERIEGRRIEIEPREVRRLRRGQYTVDQQLDLHGMNAGDARKAIEQFIDKRKKEGDRVVRLIHGKGSHSARGVSVLRGEIAAWLSQGPAKRHIAAFATAPPEDGGTGALLVLLMRGRS